MPMRYVEGKSGSRMKPTRCGASSSCSPLWRRYRHDCSTGNAGPWRRLYNDPERAWAGFDPSDRLSTRARPAGGLGRGLRTVGPVAPPQGRCPSLVRRPRNPGGTDPLSANPGPLRACTSPRPHRRLHPPGHTPGQPWAGSGTQNSAALAKHPTARGTLPGLAGFRDAAITPVRDRKRPHSKYPRPQDKQPQSKHNHQGAGHRATSQTALPPDLSPVRSA